MRRPTVWRRASTCRQTGLAAIAGVLLAAGCGGQAEDASTVAKPVPPPDASPVATEPPKPGNAVEPPAGGGATQAPPRRRRPERSQIFSTTARRSFARLAASLPGDEGIAASAVGTGRRVERLGTFRSGVAWSTAKIPIAMAVIEDGGSADASDVRSAITASDNAAAERLWDSLGGGRAAARAADDQLRAAGDLRTRVESRRVRPEFTAFGQTVWSLADQARFAAGLACAGAGADVLALMGEVTSSQRWGLGAAREAYFKGGWGPGSRPGVNGGYVDRQLGVVMIDGRPLAVAIASAPADGTHETGTRHLTAIARWISENARSQALRTELRC